MKKGFTTPREKDNESSLSLFSNAGGANPRLCRGFTMIEILITVSIIAVVALFTIGNGIDTNARADVASEHTTLLELLTHARNQAMNNVNQTPHGVHISSNAFTSFEGLTYNPSDPANKDTVRNTSVSATGLTDIVFDQLSGRATPSSGSITLSKGDSTRSITINAEGRIDW